jgi:hypothetical protein
MDLTPGCTCARAALTDDKLAKLCQEGKCFKCKHQGHIGHNVPIIIPKYMPPILVLLVVVHQLPLSPLGMPSRPKS